MHKLPVLISLLLLFSCVLGSARAAAGYWFTDDANDESGAEDPTITTSTTTSTAAAWSSTAATHTHMSDTAAASAASAAAAQPNSLIASVLLDHAELKAAIACFRDSSVCQQPQPRAVVGEKIVAMLIRHDRREQRTLYPMAVFVEPAQSIKMKTEHVQVLSQLIDLAHADMNDTHVQNTLNKIINEVVKHVSEEERSFLPPLSQFLSAHSKLNTALSQKWQSITKTSLPTVVEMVQNDHLMFKVMLKAFESTADSALKQQIARVLSAQKNTHMKCEEHVIYPLIQHTSGASVANKLQASHDKIAAMSLKNVPANKFEQTVIKMMRAMNTHMNMEEHYFNSAGLQSYLKSNPNTCSASLKAFCNCVLNE